ncbi:hypothetical protein RRG08_042605 [Elysia crispata]|uniref:Uncharacterized protein n=1 Tax=Elysia crispata TaxID=231223 RepID=A0AAE0XPX7_9GAST|nr:hypothetical protein RRG08_042605 [Elysia crispata]
MPSNEDRECGTFCLVFISVVLAWIGLYYNGFPGARPDLKENQRSELDPQCLHFLLAYLGFISKHINLVVLFKLIEAPHWRNSENVLLWTRLLALVSALCYLADVALWIANDRPDQWSKNATSEGGISQWIPLLDFVIDLISALCLVL